MINFNTLPTNKPITEIKPGTYFATVEKAEMKAPKDPSKKPYLSLTFALTNEKGQSCGKIFDIIADSEHNLVRYKLQRFIVALELNITGNFELADLTKIVVGKKLLVDVTKDVKSEQPRMVVDMFKNMIFYPVSMASEILGLAAVGEINASDAVDTPIYNDDTEY